MNERKLFVDFGKTVAIIAVLVDHTYNVFYSNQDISILSWFSVSLFIMLSGITLWNSNEKHIKDFICNGGNNCYSVLKNLTYSRIKKIIVPYVIAVAVYQIVECGMFNFLPWLKFCVYFNISGPFYYVSLYVQLLLVSSIIYLLIKRIERIEKQNIRIIAWLFLTLVILMVGKWTTNHSVVMDIYGGGGVVFGGTYLIAFYVGMIFAKTAKKYKSRTCCSAHLLGLFICCLVWCGFILKYRITLDRYLGFGYGVNPPSISLLLLAFIILSMIYTFFELLENYKLNFPSRYFQIKTE